jgi:hypothetical protein
MEPSDLKKVDAKIRMMKRSAEELSRLSKDFPAINRNVARILASIKMLEINVSDLVDLDSNS